MSLALPTFFLYLFLPLTWSLIGYQFGDNKSDKRFEPENGEMVYELPSPPKYIAACFRLYVHFNRYSSLVPIMDFRTNYEENYMDFLFGK